MEEQDVEAEAANTGEANHDWLLDGAALDMGDVTWSFSDVSEFRKALENSAPDLLNEYNKVHTLSHDIPIGKGSTLHVTESFTLGSWLRRPRRAVVFLSSSVHKGSGWSIPVSGYNGTEMVAQRGMFAFTVDYIGVGKSFIPASGRDATVGVNAEAIRQLVKYIRFFRSVPKIDLVGEGYGGMVAVRLAADARRVRACVIIALPYKNLAGGPNTAANLSERLAGLPDGYLTMEPDAYDIFHVGTPSEVKEYISSTQHGDYPVAFTTVILEDPPFFDPSVARVPGLLLFGSKDYVIGPDDPQDLAADYGTDGAQLLVSEDAGHAIRVESPQIAHWFWKQVFNFIDP